MIYTILCDAYGRDISVNKRDCCAKLQPLPSFTEEINEYIDKAKNQQTRDERLCAYTVLFASVNQLFGVKIPKIGRTYSGKPYIDGFADNIFFNISHSDGLVAVSISDEGEIGVDIQSEVAPDRQERLENRFIPNLKLPEKSTDTDTLDSNFTTDVTKSRKINYFLCEIHNDSLEFLEIQLQDAKNEDFSTKWSYAESLIKLSGGGFADISSVDKISDNSRVELKELSINKKRFFLATAIKNK